MAFCLLSHTKVLLVHCRDKKNGQLPANVVMVNAPYECSQSAYIFKIHRWFVHAKVIIALIILNSQLDSVEKKSSRTKLHRVTFQNLAFSWRICLPLDSVYCIVQYLGNVFDFDQIRLLGRILKSSQFERM